MSKDRLLSLGSIESIDHDGSSSCSCFSSTRYKAKQMWSDSCDFGKKVLEMGRKDPRKVVYPAKMGFALALVSLLLFWEMPVEDVSQYTIWAILTVIVMFEFSIGATFIKGFNRALGTFCAGMLAFLFAGLSVLAGPWEKVVIVISFFITGYCASYLRLYPTMAPYDYGYRVFVLTFCILMVAGNRNGGYILAILTRLVLIAVGACICFIVNICIYPIWAGDDLHRLVVNNFKELASSLEGCVNGYLKSVNYERAGSRFMSQATGDQLYLGYKSVIDSASREQTLLGFAIWEPPHGRYRKLNYPWRTYVKVSTAVRHCAYTVMALHGCILSEIQAPPEKRQVFRSQLQQVSMEGAKVLRELGSKIERMEKLGTVKNILEQVHEAAEQLQRKIDQRSFILVNSESWEIGSRKKDLEDLDAHDQDQDHAMKFGAKSLSETAIYIHPPLTRLPIKDLPKQNPRRLVPWPSSFSLEGDGLIGEDEIKTYESASALSLATFASLLIEFVARLQNVEDCFEELCEEAEFRDPDLIVLTECGGLWTRLVRSLRFKKS
ncbi:aluminum-activated malate transporter 9 [Perilla frutescens var. hirtella]|uniref:Aluminum-activated malate transporter 9 n=1 Tax=Perilla frutescens var. hirtella TaxID=608512 RepID=A0AAD4PBR9_PERFH|nr:aluminum-activated malate transporter 9 [Perilla frutescens var. hirtella]